MIKGSALGPGELAPVHWRKSSYSGTAGNCIEVAAVDNGRARSVRDSKKSAGPALMFPVAEWSAFVAAVGVGEFL